MLTDKQKKEMREYEKQRRKKMKELRKGYSDMTREEKIKEVKRLREQVRKRVERLLPLEKEYGPIPALEAIEHDRKGYSSFDVEKRKIAIKDENGKTIPISKLSDDQLNEIMRQATKWLTAKTSQVSGAKSSIIKRTKNTMNTLSGIIEGSETIDDFIQNEKSEKEILDVAKQMSTFWDVIDKIRSGENKSIADKILNPDEYNEVFENVLDLTEDPLYKNATTGELAEILSSMLEKKAEIISRERKKEAEDLVLKSGGRLPDDLSRMRGGFLGNRKIR